MCFTVSVGYAALVKVLQEMLWGPISTPPENLHYTLILNILFFVIIDNRTQTNIIIVLIVEHSPSSCLTKFMQQ
jgi:hypothetical protein